MNNIVIISRNGSFHIAVAGTGSDGSSVVFPVAEVNASAVAMLMSAGMKLESSDATGEFLAGFLDEHSSMNEDEK